MESRVHQRGLIKSRLLMGLFRKDLCHLETFLFIFFSTAGTLAPSHLSYFPSSHQSTHSHRFTCTAQSDGAHSLIRA